MSNDMVEEACGNFGSVVGHRHSLYPFGKVNGHDNNVLVPTVRGWLTLHEVNAPLVEGVGCDD